MAKPDEITITLTRKQYNQLVKELISLNSNSQNPTEALYCGSKVVDTIRTQGDYQNTLIERLA